PARAGRAGGARPRRGARRGALGGARSRGRARVSRRPVGARAAPLVLVIAALLGGACASTSGDAYLNAMAAGERAYHAGRYREAARAFSGAAARAERLKDRD